MTPITDKIKQLPDGGIKLPVRYDHRQEVIRDDDFGTVLLEFSQSLTFTDAQVAERSARHKIQGEYIATCINEHARLVSELETAKRALEQIREWTGNDHAMRQIATDALSNEEPWI